LKIVSALGELKERGIIIRERIIIRVFVIIYLLFEIEESKEKLN